MYVCQREREREYLVTSGLRSRMLKMGSVYNELNMSIEGWSERERVYVCQRERIPGDIRVKVQDVEDGLRVQRVEYVN